VQRQQGAAGGVVGSDSPSMSFFGSQGLHQKHKLHQNKQTMKASLIFFPNESKKNQHSCKVPLYLRVWYKKGKAESRLNFDLTSDQLKLWNGITMAFAGKKCTRKPLSKQDRIHVS